MLWCHRALPLPPLPSQLQAVMAISRHQRLVTSRLIAPARGLMCSSPLAATCTIPWI